MRIVAPFSRNLFHVGWLIGGLVQLYCILLIEGDFFFVTGGVPFFAFESVFDVFNGLVSVYWSVIRGAYPSSFHILYCWDFWR